MKWILNPSTFLVLALTLSGCGGGNYTTTMSNVNATPPTFMVASKIPTTLYLVLDPAKIKNVYAPVAERRGTVLTINDFHVFVTRDLKDVLTPFFKEVKVVGPADTLPDEPHVVADVKVDNVILKEDVVSNGSVAVNYMRLVMTWGFALRTSDSEDYMFSFAGVSASTETSNGVEDYVAQMVESSIAGLLEKWGEADVRPRLRAWADGSTTAGADAEPADEDAVAE